MSTDEHVFAHSLADLMAGVAVTFLLVACVFILKATAEKEAANTKLHTAKDELETSIGSLRDLANEINDETSAYSAVAHADSDPNDPLLLTITLNRSVFSFERGGCDLTAPMKDAINHGVSALVRRVCAPGDLNHRLLSITLEGHTDGRPFVHPRDATCVIERSPCAGSDVSDACRRRGFENNVQLSAARAQHLFFQLRASLQPDADGGVNVEDCLDRMFVVSGRGSVEAHLFDAGQEDRDVEARDRRVVMRVRVRGAAPDTLRADDDGDAGR